VDREVSGALSFTATLVLLAAFLSLVMGTAYVGMMLREDAASAMTDLGNELRVGFLDDLVGQFEEFPAATAFGILKTYRSFIPELHCMFTRTTTNINTSVIPVASNLSGKASLQVLRREQGWYTVILHREGCNWAQHSQTTRYLPNGVSDSFNVTTRQFTRRVSNPVVLTGALAWGGVSESPPGSGEYVGSVAGWASSNGAALGVANSLIASNSTLSFIPTTSGIATSVGIRLQLGASGGLYLRLPRGVVDSFPGATVTDRFRAYLNSNGVTLTYQLASPVVVVACSCV